MQRFIKSRLAKLGFHASEEPVISKGTTPSPSVPILYADPTRPVAARIKQDSPPWADRFIGDRPRTFGQASFLLPRTSSPKPPVDTAPNYHLPFDILVQIFSHYAEIEDEASPLERILEICHFWRDTALDHRPLWTTFRLTIKDSRQVVYWRKRFPQRANRFGPDTLLDIAIELVNRPQDRSVLPGGTYRSVGMNGTDKDPSGFLGILKVVGGRRGAKAVRWKSLSLDVINLAGLKFEDMELLDRFLQARTPHMKSLELYGIVTPYRDHKRIFPYTPRLRRAIFHSCQLSYYPDTSTLHSLTWYSIQDASSLPRRNVIHALTAAQKITFLEIGLDWAYWDTSLVFHRVKTLKMPATVCPDLAIMIQVPSLRHLSIGLDSAAKFVYIKDCKGIPLGQVETLEIFYVSGAAETTAEEIAATNAVVVNGLKLFFAQMTNLRVLEWKEDLARKQALLKLVVELFMGGSVDEEVIQMPGRMIRNG